MITYPPELLPSPDEGQAADVIVCANHPNCPAANAEISRLTSRLKDLTEALRPFATLADEFRDVVPDDFKIGLFTTSLHEPTVGDLRKARSVIEAEIKEK